MNTILDDRKNNFPSSLYHSFNKPFTVERAEKHVYYSPNDERPYLDLYNNVCHIGHSNLRIVEAVKDGYSTINIHTRYLHENLTKYVTHLQNYLPEGYKVLFTNSGSEANDLALQITLNAQTNGKDQIGSFERSYHGTTWLCNQISHLTPTGVVSNPLKKLDVVFFSPDESVDTLQTYPCVKAFILESIQGVGGNIEISKEWLRAIREKTDIMICDEVQTGFGRSGGTFWAFEKAHIYPDIITCGKPIANGYPMGACIFRKELEKYLPSTYFNTFGGNSVACHVAKVVLEEVENKNVVRYCEEMGIFLKKSLEKIGNPIKKVTGSGLFLGIHFDSTINVKNIVESLKDNYIIVGIGHNDVLRIKPPVTVTQEDLQYFVDTLCVTLKK